MSSGGNGGSVAAGCLAAAEAGYGGGASGCPANTEETAFSTPSTAPVTASSADSNACHALQHNVMRLRGKSLASSIVGAQEEWQFHRNVNVFTWETQCHSEHLHTQPFSNETLAPSSDTL